MFKLPGVKVGSNIEALFIASGFIVVQWGHAEQCLELIVSTLYDHYPGEKPKRLPFVLEKKLAFIRQCAESAEYPLRCAADLTKLATDFEALANVRHGLIHGAITSLEPESDTFKFIKLRSNKSSGKPKMVRLSSSEFPFLTMSLLRLGEDTNRLARTLWDSKPSVL